MQECGTNFRDHGGPGEPANRIDCGGEGLVPSPMDTTGMHDRSKFRGERGQFWSSIAVRKIII